MVELSLSLLFRLKRFASSFLSRQDGAEAVDIKDDLLIVEETSPVVFDWGKFNDENSSLTRNRLLDGSSIEDNLTWCAEARLFPIGKGFEMACPPLSGA